MLEDKDFSESNMEKWCAELAYDNAESYDRFVEDGLDEDCKRLYEKGISAFDGNAPTYHIELKDKPLLVWDFHSLLLCIELLFSIMLTDDATPLRMCKNCQKAFIAKGIDDEFCSETCRKKYYKRKDDR